MKRELCRYCRKPMANEQDCDDFQPGEGEHLCWHILQNCDQDAEEGIDLRDNEIARLERELEDWKDKLDGSEITHEATRADLRDCKRELEQGYQERLLLTAKLNNMSAEVSRAEYERDQAVARRDEFFRELEQEREQRRLARLNAIRIQEELEQERQDRKQADIDAIRALGERNDARKALDQERQLVASLQALATTDHESKEAFIRRCREALGINEPARFWVPGESCPECGNDLSVRDHGDGRVYDGEECRCCECAFTGYLSVDEDGQTLVNEYQANEAVDPP